MRVLVAGAGGVVGVRLVPQLVARGHHVTATTTHSDKVETLRALGAEAIVMNGLDATSVREAVLSAQPDAVIHQMTALSGKPDIKHLDRWLAVTNELRTTGTRHLLAAAEAAGVERFIAQSFTGWTNSRTGGALKTEDDPLEDDPAKDQVKSLAAIRFLEGAVLEAPLKGVTLRYGSLYGPAASDVLMAAVRARQWPIVGDGAGVWSWLHVDDAAAATVAALERASCGLYNIVDDDPAAVADWLPYLAKVADAKPPLRAPVWLARVLIGDVGVRWMTEARGASNEKAKHELAWQPAYRSWREGFTATADAPQPPTRRITSGSSFAVDPLAEAGGR